MKYFILFVILITMYSCESRTIDDVSTPVTYTSDIKQIIEYNCISCHAPKGGEGSYFRLTNYTEVSSSVDKIIFRIEKPATDTLKMPQGGSLSTSDIALIKKWKSTGLKE